jgi:cyanophycin synthetase
VAGGAAPITRRLTLLERLARAGKPGCEIGARLDLARSLGLRAAGRRARDDRALGRLAASRDAVYGRLWSEAAAEVGAEVVELGSGFLELRKDGRRTRVLRESTMLDDLVTVELSEDKPVVHRLLVSAGLPVPPHLEFDIAEIDRAAAFLAQEGTCVVKPAAGTDVGVGVTAGIGTRQELVRAALRAGRSSRRLLIERQLAGDVYRLLLLDGRLLDAVHRRPPTLVGDGRASIGELVRAENARRLTAQGRDGLWLLKIDLDSILALQHRGSTLDSVPRAGTAIQVKSVTSQNCVEDNETVRGQVSPALVAEAAAAARCVGLRLAGVDVIANDLSRPLAESGGAIVEVNCTPGLHHHYLVADRAHATPVAVPILRALLGQPAG